MIFSRDEICDHHYSVCNPDLHDIFSEIQYFHRKLYLEHMFEYMNKFWKKHKNNREFSLLLTNFSLTSSMEILKYIDDVLYYLIHLNYIFRYYS